MSPFGVVIVSTTSAALKAEKLLRTAGITEQLIPTPREYSANCGLAVRFNWAQRKQIARLLQEGGIEVIGIYRLQEK